jgi:hypothetical protein
LDARDARIRELEDQLNKELKNHWDTELARIQAVNNLEAQVFAMTMVMNSHRDLWRRLSWLESKGGEAVGLAT